MKILITGGAGFIGTSLIPILLEKKYEVTVLDNLMYGGYPLLPFFKYSNFNFIKGDIRDKITLKNVMKKNDIVIHLAAIVGYGACRKDPKLAHDVNFLGTKNIVDNLSKNQYIFFASTGSNYGELKDQICTEETPLKPLSIYGKTKTAGEMYVIENANKYIAYRFATAFGVSPRFRLDLLPNEFVYQAVTQKYLVVYEKHFMRTFIHVRDMANSFLFAINNLKKMTNQVYNVGSEKLNYSKEEICNMIIKQTGAYVHYAEVGKDADKRNYEVSYEKIGKIGFKTTISFEAGIKELIQSIPTIQINNPYLNG